jgi:hypothetical protein
MIMWSVRGRGGKPLAANSAMYFMEIILTPEFGLLFDPEAIGDILPRNRKIVF